MISCRKHNAFRIRLAAGERRNGGQGCGSGAAATTAKALPLFMCVIKPSLGCPEEATAAGLVLLIPSVIRSLHGFRWQVVAVGCARTRPLRDCSILHHIRQMLANYYEVKEEMAYFSVFLTCYRCEQNVNARAAPGSDRKPRRRGKGPSG